MKERWKVIPGDWKYQYYISTGGCVGRRKKSGGYRRFGLASDKSHYKQVSLRRKDSTVVKVYVHRLVAEAYLEKPEWGEVVHHINHIRSDNRLENLAWASHSCNQRYRRKREREQAADAGSSHMVGPAPQLCDLPLARVRSSQEDGSPSPRWWSEQVEMPSPQMLPLAMFSMSWCVSLWQDSCFDSRPEHGYTFVCQAGV